MTPRYCMNWLFFPSATASRIRNLLRALGGR